MKVFKVPADQIESVSGRWGQHEIRPRVSLYGWAVVNVGASLSLSIHDNIRAILLGFEKIDYDPNDFPEIEIEGLEE
jgi:hypothetical protein